LVLTGTGTAGAYHAGVLRALDEAGVKIDIVAGRGIGVVGAMFAAVDGGARLWSANGLWRHDRVAHLYRWRRSLRVAAWTLAVALSLLLVPAAALVVGLLVYPIALLLQAVDLEAGAALGLGYRSLLDRVFQSDALPTILPRLVTLVLVVLVGTLVAGAFAAGLRGSARRRVSGPLWWRLLRAPLMASSASQLFLDGVWQLMRGATPIARPGVGDLGARYSELLSENVGQPGFRELIVTAHDIDARCDLVFALLGEPYRQRFFLKRVGPEGTHRHLETLDLTGVARSHATDALVGALALPAATEPHLLVFAPESVWRGEAHRLCDRPDAIGRLLEEVALAGAEQAIVVAGVPSASGPHALRSGRLDARGQVGEYLASIETSSLQDAVSARTGLFQAIFQIRPAHNPLGPFDFRGAYDERSDRMAGLAELVDRGYEDGYRQFVDPVVGASGERLERTPLRAAP
jgi:hypothetical protein